MPRVDVLGMPVDGLHRPSGKRGTPPMLPRCAKRYILALRIWCWVRGDVQCLGGRGFHNPTPYPCAQALMGTSYHHAVPASAVDLHLRTWPSLSTLYVQRCTI